MNNYQFEIECLKFRGFHHVFYPRDMKKKAHLNEILYFADQAGKMAAEDYYIDLVDIDMEWIRFKRKYRGALKHLLKNEGVKATKDFIRYWREGFTEECERKNA